MNSSAIREKAATIHRCNYTAAFSTWHKRPILKGREVTVTNVLEDIIKERRWTVDAITITPNSVTLVNLSLRPDDAPAKAINILRNRSATRLKEHIDGKIWTRKMVVVSVGPDLDTQEIQKHLERLE